MPTIDPLTKGDVMRTIEVSLGEEFFRVLSENGVGQVDKRLCDAIGYLSLWGFGGQAVKVQIYGDRQGELSASYYDKDDNRILVIGAVPDDNWVYSFHS
jgi:hypothetical protein